MAELVGVVASGISIATLAAQIASSVIKLKGYWSELKEAPEDIRLLIEEVEDVQLVLADIEEDRRCNPISQTASGSISASRCLERCKKGADLLKNLADELGAEITSSIIYKVSNGRYKWRDFEPSALVRLQPDIIVSRLTHSATYLPRSKSLVTTTETIRKDQPVTSCQSLVGSSISRNTKNPSPVTEDDTLAVQHKRVQQNTPVTYLRWQVWVINQAWSTELLRTTSGWTFNIRMHNVISYDSSTFIAIETGNVNMLQELFRKGQASLFDMFPIDEYNDTWNTYYTLLDTAIFGGHPAMCKFLIEQSVSSDEKRYSFWPTKLDLVAVNVKARDTDAESKIKIALMLKEYQSFDLSSFLRMLRMFRGSEKAFQLFKQFLNIPYHELPLELRVDVAIQIARSALFNSPKVFEMALDEHPISAEAITMHVPWNGTLLHGVASAIGGIMSKETCIWTTTRTSKDLPGWLAILRTLITGGADLHSVSSIYTADSSYFRASPFLSLFLGLTERANLSHALPFAPTLAFWLTALDACGVDLVAYGRKERAWQQGPDAIRTFESAHDILKDSYRYEWRLIDFEYGPAPSDWQVYMADPAAEFAGDFWWWVEEKEMVVPGSWLD